MQDSIRKTRKPHQTQFLVHPATRGETSRLYTPSPNKDSPHGRQMAKLIRIYSGSWREVRG